MRNSTLDFFFYNVGKFAGRRWKQRFSYRLLEFREPLATFRFDISKCAKSLITSPGFFPFLVVELSCHPHAGFVLAHRLRTTVLYSYGKRNFTCLPVRFESVFRLTRSESVRFRPIGFFTLNVLNMDSVPIEYVQVCVTLKRRH